MLAQHAFAIPTSGLIEPEIPDRTLPQLPDGEWGINAAAARGVHPDKGLQVYIHPWSLMSRGDRCELLLDGSLVDEYVISDDTDIGQRITLFVAPRHLSTGAYTLSYRVKRLNQEWESQTPPVKLRVKLEIPAGQDTDPEEGRHSNLFMYIPPGIVNGIIDGDIAEEGVPIVIRAAAGAEPPYPDAAVGDIAVLSWGGVYVESDPLTAEQIRDPAANPFVIRITKETIEKAGDTDDSGLAVSFRIRDIVSNYSEDWCKETRLRVSLNVDLRNAPLVKEAQNNVVDLDKLGDKGITLQVVARTPQFEHNETIKPVLRGTAQNGDVIEFPAAPQLVDNLPHTYEFLFSNADLRTLAKTQVTFSYEVERPGAIDTFHSKRQFVRIDGEPLQLAAPLADDMENGALDPDLAFTRIRIPHDPVIEVGMGIAVQWIGIRPNGSTYNPLFEPYLPDRVEVEDKNGFTVTVEGKHLKTIEGGTLTLAYKLLIAEGDTIISRLSRSTAPLNVGEPRFELDAPLVLGVKDGALEPADLPNGESRLTAPRPTGTPSKDKDEVTYRWEGEVSGKTQDMIRLNGLSANRDVNFNLRADFITKHIEPNRDKKVTVAYEIWRAETDTTSYSNPLTFVVGQAQQELLDPAKVREAIDDILDPANAPNGATVVIPANRPENAGDHFYMKWTTIDDEFEDDKSVSGNNQGKDVEFPIDREKVLASLNKAVIVSYRVDLFEGGSATGEDYDLKVEAQEFKLPVATFREATGAQKDQLNPDDVYPNGATVVIAASAQLKTDDEITVTVAGKTTTPHPHTVLSTEADKELTSIKIPHARINAEEGGEIALSYTVERAAGSSDGPSDPTVYDVRKVIGSGTLKVLGARYNRSTYRASSATRILSAFNANTGQPLVAEWKYPSGSQWSSGTTWRDTAPHEPLQVRTADDLVTLNPANIIGNGIDTTVTGLAAFVAHRDVGDVVGWGNAAYGATIPSTIITMDDIVEVSCSRSAYAARRANSAVVAWGTAAEGASMIGIDPLNFKQVVGNATAFAGLKTTGRIVAWGTATDGGTLPEAIGNLTDVVSITAAGQAFAAHRATGQLVAWGLAANGGEIPTDIGGFTDINALLGSYGAFAGHRANGRIVGWGHATYGGAVPADIAAMTDIIELSCANAQAFTARRDSGQVVAWGTAEYGGTIDPLIGGLTDIVEVSSTWRAFAARRGNGHVVAWGRPAEGGEVPAGIAALDDIVQVCGSSMAFAALRSNGTVVAWGDATVGGDTSTVVDQLTQVQALYDNTHGFTALTADGRVVTWGNADGGGDSSAVQDRLRGKVSHLANPVSRGLALKAQRWLEVNTGPSTQTEKSSR